MRKEFWKAEPGGNIFERLSISCIVSNLATLREALAIPLVCVPTAFFPGKEMTEEANRGYVDTKKLMAYLNTFHDLGHFDCSLLVLLFWENELKDNIEISMGHEQ